jgi:hypothetical protein
VAVGRAPIPVGKVLRGVRIDRIFEGASKIMKSSFAREAVDPRQAGAFVDTDAAAGDRAEAAPPVSPTFSAALPGVGYAAWSTSSSTRRRSRDRLATEEFEGWFTWLEDGVARAPAPTPTDTDGFAPFLAVTRRSGRRQ